MKKISGQVYTEGAQGALMQFAADNGWLLDTTARTTRYGKTEQNRFIWIKDAQDGGKWRIEFDYRVRESYGLTDDRLRGIRVEFIPADAVLQAVEDDPDGRMVWSTIERVKALGYDGDKLRQVTRWNESPLFHAADTEPKNLQKVPTLRKRAEALLQKPDLVIWLAAEGIHLAEVARQEKYERDRAEAKLRARPLPIKEGMEDGYGEGSFWKLQYRLARAAEVIKRADGKTNLYAAVAEAQAALDAVKDALVPVDNPLNDAIEAWVATQAS